MTDACVLGIDLGTSGCKAGLFTGGGALLACEQAAYPILRDAGGRAEQNLEDWWHAACEASRRAMRGSGVPVASVHAIGVSGQIGSQVLIDHGGEPLRAAITWQDTRSGSEAALLEARFGRRHLAEMLGIDLPPGPAWPLPRLLWLQRHEPATLARAWRFLQAKDYVTFRLTGELASDASSWRGLIDQATATPALTLLRALDLPLDLVPPIRSPAEIAGRVAPHTATLMGVLPGTPVVTGWNDLNCALLGSGAIQAGSGFLISGTSEHLGTTWRTQRPDVGAENLMFAPYLPSEHDGASHVLYGVTSAGGGSLDWYAAQFVPDLLAAYGFALPPGAMPHQETVAAAIPAGAGGLLFLPYLHGERAPIWDASARGVLFGLHGGHRHGHILRAVLEGVAFSLRQVLEVVEAAVGLTIPSVCASGGPIGLDLWNRIKASVLNRPLMIPHVLQAGCLGAAILAAVGARWYTGPAEAVHAMVAIERQVDPVAQDVEVYDDLFPIYTGLYPRLQDAFALLAHTASLQGDIP